MSAPWNAPAHRLSREMVDCGIIGDGITDDGDALLRYLGLHQGGRIALPRTCAPGVPASSASYYSSRTLRLTGAGTILKGDGGGYVGGTILRFAPGVTGVIMQEQGCKIQDLTLLGSEPWTGSWYYEAVLPCGYGGASAADGVRVAHCYNTLENMCIIGFGRHGVNASNQDTGGPSDDCLFSRLFLGNNRGHGFNIDGGDSNCCQWDSCVYFVNQLWGKRAASFLSGTHINDQATQNGFDDTARNAVPLQRDLASVSRQDGTVSLTFVSPYVTPGGPFVVGHGITVIECADPSFLGSFVVTEVMDESSLKFSQAGPDTPPLLFPGKARMAQPAETWAAAGCSGGAYLAPVLNSRQVWINPYAEGGQGVAMTSANLVKAPVWNCDYDLTMGLPGQLDAALVGVGSLGANQLLSTVWPVDAIAHRFLRMGRTAAQPIHELYQDPVSLKTLWKQVISEHQWALWYGDPDQDPAARCFLCIDATTGQVLIDGTPFSPGGRS